MVKIEYCVVIKLILRPNSQSKTEWESTYTDMSGEHTCRNRIFPIRNRYKFSCGQQVSAAAAASKWVLYASVFCCCLLNMPSFACVFFLLFRVHSSRTLQLKEYETQLHTTEYIYAVRGYTTSLSFTCGGSVFSPSQMCFILWYCTKHTTFGEWMRVFVCVCVWVRKLNE